MYCNHCGTQNNDSANYCSNCGSILAHNSQSYYSESTPVVEQKSKIVAGILGIFVGTLGIHNFYLGYNEKAIIQLLLSTVGVLLIIGPVIAGLWGLVEGVLILVGSINVDANGVPLKD